MRISGGDIRRLGLISLISAGVGLPFAANAATNTITRDSRCTDAYSGVTGTTLRGVLKWDNAIRPMANGKNVRRDVIKNETKRRQLLKELGGGDTGTAKEKARKILDGRGTVRFRGLGMASFRTFAKAIEDAFPDDNPNVETRGQIYAFWNNPDKSENAKKSCVAVHMQIKYLKGGRAHEFAYRLHIFFKSRAPKKRTTSADAGHDPNDIFPDTVQIKVTEAMAGPRQYKLWDRGQSVQVGYAVRQLFRGKRGEKKKWGRFPRRSPIYETSDDNCIDMMFVPNPPEVLGTLAPPGYCLGRCASPPVINTGF